MLTKYTLGMPQQVFSGEDALSNIPDVLKAEGVKNLQCSPTKAFRAQDF